MLEVLAIAGCALSDRLRGSSEDYIGPWPVSGTFWMLLYGWCVAFLIGHGGDAITLMVIAGLIAGERHGWGHNLGQVFGTVTPSSEPERYQRLFGGYFERHYWQGLAFRGMLWGIYAAGIMVLYAIMRAIASWFGAALPEAWDPAMLNVVLAFTMAQPAAAWIAARRWEGDKAWDAHEWIRGLLVGITVLGLSHV